MSIASSEEAGTPDPAERTEKEKLIYEESRRAIDQQVRIVEGLRTRAGMLITAASITTGFLGARGLDQRAAAREGTDAPLFDAVTWLAITSFCAVIAVSAAILIVRGWVFSHSAHKLIDQLLDADPPHPLPVLHRHFSYWNGVHYDRNRRKTQLLYRLFLAGVALLLLEVVAWLVVIARTTE